MTDTPELADTPDITDVPDMTVAPEVADIPETIDTPDMTATPEATDIPEITDVPDMAATQEVADMPETTATPESPDTPNITERMLQRRTKTLTALVARLQRERDRALEELAICRAERDQAAAMLVQIETNAAETLATAELSAEPTDIQLAQELDECHRVLHAMKAELERTKEDLARAEFRLRGQEARMRRQTAGTAAEDQ